METLEQRCEICLKLTIKTPKRRLCSSVSVVNFEQVNGGWVRTAGTSLFDWPVAMTWWKYGHSMLPGAVPGKRTSDINITNGVVAQCDVSVIKRTFVSDSTLIKNEF